MAKFSDTILGIGGDTNIYLINILDYTLVKTINEFSYGKFCSFYMGDLGIIFILTRSFRDVQTFDEEFEVYSTSSYSYKFKEDTMELVYVSMPKKPGSKDIKCIIY